MSSFQASNDSLSPKSYLYMERNIPCTTLSSFNLGKPIESQYYNTKPTDEQIIIETLCLLANIS
jgi:hypothetical protein